MGLWWLSDIVYKSCPSKGSTLRAAFLRKMIDHWEGWLLTTPCPFWEGLEASHSGNSVPCRSPASEAAWLQQPSESAGCHLCHLQPQWHRAAGQHGGRAGMAGTQGGSSPPPPPYLAARAVSATSTTVRLIRSLTINDVTMKYRNAMALLKFPENYPGLERKP